MPMVSKLRASWLAGFIDGEGWIGIYKRKQGWHCCQLTISNTNKEIIEWLQKSFGGGIITKKVFIGQNWKEQYWWQVYNKKRLDAILLAIIPYLKVKKKQAILVRKFMKTYKKEFYKYKRNGRGQIVRKIPLQYELREKLHQEVKQLNQKGHIVQAERLNKESSVEQAIV